MARYKYILIDLDDTLIDFTAAQRASFFATSKFFGLEASEESFATFKSINSELWIAYEKSELSKAEVFSIRWRRYFQLFGKSLSPTDVNQYFLNHLGEHPLLFEGALDFCRKLSRDCKLAVVTNGDSVTQRMKIDNSGLGPYICALTVSDEVGAAKPDSRIFVEAFKALGVTVKAEALMVGDNIHADVVGAMNFGIDVCWFNPSGVAIPEGIAIPFAASTYDEILNWIK
jgi:YjjG family noncanonical pyrimidine nucleotidase